MIGMAELLLDDTTLAETHRVSISKIMRSGEILLELVGMVLVRPFSPTVPHRRSLSANFLRSLPSPNFLRLFRSRLASQDMGKVESGKLLLEHRAFSLDEVVSDARMFSIGATKKGLTLKEDFEPFFRGQVLGDMPRLRQVLSNLLSNAIKVRPAPGPSVRLVRFADVGHSLRRRARSLFVSSKRGNRGTTFAFASRSKTPASASRRARFRSCSNRFIKPTLRRRESLAELDSGYVSRRMYALSRLLRRRRRRERG
jgi:signal transduction histidine kinase